MSESCLAFLNRASILILKGLVQEAIKILEEAIEVFSFDPRPRERVADLYLGLGRTQDAVASYLEAAELYAKLENPLRTLELCKRALEFEPKNSKVHLILKKASAPRERFTKTKIQEDVNPAIENDLWDFENDQTSITHLPPFGIAQEQENKDSSLTIEKKKLVKDQEKERSKQENKSQSQSRASVVFLPTTKRIRHDTVPEPPSSLEETFLSVDAPSKPLGSGEKSSKPAVFRTPYFSTFSSVPKLPSIPLFSELPAGAFRKVLGASVRRSYRSGEIVFDEGSSGNSCFIILAGKVSVWRNLSEGRHCVALLGPGDFFGEMALLSGLPRSASVEALRKAEVFEIPGDLLTQLSLEHKSVRLVLQRFYKRRVLENLALVDPLFASFSPEEREALTRVFWVREGKVNNYLLTEGVYANGFYVILSALCEMSVKGRLGRIVPLRTLYTGDYFGGGSILEKRPSLVTVQVVKEGRLLYFPKKSFYEMVFTHKTAQQAVATILAERRKLVEQVQSGEPISFSRIEMP